MSDFEFYRLGWFVSAGLAVAFLATLAHLLEARHRWKASLRREADLLADVDRAVREWLEFHDLGPEVEWRGELSSDFLQHVLKKIREKDGDNTERLLNAIDDLLDADDADTRQRAEEIRDEVREDRLLTWQSSLKVKMRDDVARMYRILEAKRKARKE